MSDIRSSEYLARAVQALALGSGRIRWRLTGAYIVLAPLAADGVPDPLRQAVVALQRRLPCQDGAAALPIAYAIDLLTEDQAVALAAEIVALAFQFLDA